MLSSWAAGVVDLVLARQCERCAAPGPVLCPRCLAALRSCARTIPLTLVPVPASAAGPYRGLGRDLVLQHKERGVRALAPALGRLLADAVAVHAPRGPVLLVPIPAHRLAPRGYDAVAPLARHAAAHLRADGHHVDMRPLLRRTQDHAPLKGRGREERRRLVHEVFAARSWLLGDARTVIVVDDVATTGTTLAAGCAALTRVGLPVAAVAAVCAVSRDTWAPNREPARSTLQP
jgi:predicted amidophosphoribosyltransferase